VISNGYCTLNQLKAALRMGTADTADDSLLELAIESASRLIDDDCERVFYASGTAVARYFVPSSTITVDLDDAITITEVLTDEDSDGTYETAWASTDWQAEPLNGLNAGQAWPTTRIRAIGDYDFPIDGGEATVKVTGTWGFGTAVPTIITQACQLQAARIYKRADAPFGVAGFGEMGAVRVSRTDPDVYALISKYRRTKVATA
jgi:hypothetical protein